MRGLSIRSGLVFSFAVLLFGFQAMPPSVAGGGTTRVKLVIARHGATRFDPANPMWRDGVPDPPLTEEGRRQALRLAILAKAEGVEVVCHSPLTRARETAEPVARQLNLKPISVKAFGEFNLGDLLGKDWKQSPYREQLDEVFRDPRNKRPGGESFIELSERVAPALNELLAEYPNRTVLVVAHGVTNQALIGILRGLAPAEAFALPTQSNTQAYVAEWTGKPSTQVSLREYPDPAQNSRPIHP